MRLTASYQYAGGLLGGTSRLHQARGRGDRLHAAHAPHRARLARQRRLASGTSAASQLPYYQRYFLGGETQIRGVDVRTVGPLNENNVALGGTTFVLFNAEYYFDILAAGPGAGSSTTPARRSARREPIDLRQLRTSSGVELRVTLPMLNVPFRLIYAWNIYRDTFQPARAFKFAVGTTF